MIVVRLIIKLIRFIRSLLINRLVKVRSKLRFQTLREAIAGADKIKADSGRKAMVLFNNSSGKYEALPKKVLKQVAEKRKVKGQPAQTEYRKKRPVKQSPGRFTNARVKQLEKKSAYVTR